MKPYNRLHSNGITLAPYLTAKKNARESETEDTITLAGRTILLVQEKHIVADISAARSILQRLLSQRLPVVEDTSENEVTSVTSVSYKGGTIR